MSSPSNVRFLLRSFLALSVLGLFACTDPAPPPAPPPEVIVHTVTGQSTPLTVDVIAEVKAYREVELFSRVSGQVVRQNFKPGQKVNEGDLLFSIDPRAYDESVIDAQAKLAESEAVLARAAQDVARYKPLLPDNAIPRQTYDQAVAAELQNLAIVRARRAALERARLDRSYADVRSPISGQIGLQKVEVGSLATAGQTVLATVSALDPMVAYFSIPEVEYIHFAKRFLEQKREQSAPITLILADGVDYRYPGRLDFADRALDPATGTLTLRAVFPNSDGLLRPGLSARVRIVHEVAENALLIPQKAVTELLGKQFASVVVEGNRIEQRPIRAGTRIGELWLIEDGLRAGDRIVIEGLQKARPGTIVTPVAAKTSAIPTRP